MDVKEEDLLHYGILRQSGRYPWGSGGNVPQRSRSFFDFIRDLRNKGLTDKEIADSVGMTTTQLRDTRTIAKAELRAENIRMAQKLSDKGVSNVEIGNRLGVNESVVRSYLAPGANRSQEVLTNTVEMLREQVADQKYIDIGKGVENHVGISKEKLRAAVNILEEEGYSVHYLKVKQLGTGKETRLKVLAEPGTEWAEVNKNQDKIGSITAYTNDYGHDGFENIKPPISVSEDRLQIVYNEDGGAAADGVVYIRPGVEDLNLGGSTYAQVRIQVGDGHYIKGMAIYKDDMPDGVDMLFNTNKTREQAPNKLDALKPIKEDADLPFGSLIKRQITNDQGEVTSAINLVREEGDWNNWSDSIASQVLSKQHPKVAQQQLDMTYERRQSEFDEIMALTNPTVKAKLLSEFADATDAASVHLKAAGLPRQAWHVILPFNEGSVTEIYAPNYENGEKVALIRYPHGGTFEIPELVVNNNNPAAKRIFGNAPDAVGIHTDVAERLSGADFDGDTVLVIPNRHKKIKSTPALEGLVGFDPKQSYPKYDGMKVMSNTQTEMGVISNLITDMTIRGADRDELARAVRHSMVVIDAEKHELNYKQSAKDNGISALKKKYQTNWETGKTGAATIISRAKSPEYVPERKARPAAEGGPINPVTGEKVFVPTGATRRVLRPADQGGPIDPKTGKKVYVDSDKLKTERSVKLAEAKDARKLSSGTVIENIYADHSNKLKALANKARKEQVATPKSKYSPSAAKTYSKEVQRLNAALNIAERNAPLERKAQLVANAIVKQKRDANPNMDGDSLKKIKSQALETARARVGAKKHQIEISPTEWEAIQAGAISDHKLSRILRNADVEAVKQLATPKTQVLMTPNKQARARTLLANGATRAEVAKQLGVSTTTLDRGLSDEGGA